MTEQNHRALEPPRAPRPSWWRLSRTEVLGCAAVAVLALAGLLGLPALGLSRATTLIVTAAGAVAALALLAGRSVLAEQRQGRTGAAP